MNYVGEFQIDLTWAAIQALLTDQLGASVSVDCIGEQDFDEAGDLTTVAPAVRIVFGDETASKPVENQARSYNAEQYFGLICVADMQAGIQDQRTSHLQLCAQVKHVLVGARLPLADGTKTEPIEFCGTSPLPTSNYGVAYIVKICVPNIAQFAAPNAQPQGGN